MIFSAIWFLVILIYFILSVYHNIHRLRTKSLHMKVEVSFECFIWFLHSAGPLEILGRNNRRWGMPEAGDYHYVAALVKDSPG